MPPDLGGRKGLRLVKGPAWWQEPRVLRGALAAAVLVLGTLILSVDLVGPGAAGVVVGHPSPVSVKAARSFSFVDQATTLERRRTAAGKVKRVYRSDPAARNRAENDLLGFFAVLQKAKATSRLSPEQRVRLVRRRTNPTLDPAAIRFVLSLSPRATRAFRSQALDVLDQTMEGAITEAGLEAKRDEVVSVAQQLPLSLGARRALAEAVVAYLEPNLIYDPAGTDELRRKAAARVAPVVSRWQKGQTIVSEGAVVTPAQQEALRRSGSVSGPSAVRVLGIILLVAAGIVASALYLSRLHPRIYGDFSRLLLLATVILAFLIAARLLVPFYPSYVVPFAAVAMLGTILLNAQVGIFLALLTALFGGALIGGTVAAVLVAAFSGLAGVHAVARLQSRSELMSKGLMVCAATGLLSLAVSLAVSGDVVASLRAGAWGLGGGLFAAIATAGLLPFLESGFGVTTSMHLSELANPTQPLLHRLMLEAPGTYSHSVVTGNLASAAAQEIGADALLARVGAYYHDVGKVKRPLFFVENQMGASSPHERTSPSLSCLVITAHVREGVELAGQHRLPKEVIDIIREHHGTCVMTYFYHQARMRQGETKDIVRETDYRYSEERPKSREAALVMLADSVEAAARSLPKPTAARLEQVARRIIAERLADKQLEESRLTLADLDKISRAFTHALTGLHHPRVEYPDVAELAAVRSIRGSGDPDK